MTGNVYILFLPLAIACAITLIALLSALRAGSRYAWMPLSLCLSLATGICGSSAGESLGFQQYRTETGEQRTISLPDGSTIVLDVESELRVALLDDVRNVYLDQGQAAFHVAGDPARTFTVHVNQSAIHAVRSQFHVRRKADLAIVSIIEGKLRVQSAAGNVNITSQSRAKAGMGKRFTIAADGTISLPVATPMWRITSWRDRRLAFRDYTLLEIAEEFNRYNKTPKLRVEGEILQAKTLSGVLDADDPQGFLDYLANDSRIEFDRANPDLIIIRLRSRYGFAKVMR